MGAWFYKAKIPHLIFRQIRDDFKQYIFISDNNKIVSTISYLVARKYDTSLLTNYIIAEKDSVTSRKLDASRLKYM